MRRVVGKCVPFCAKDSAMHISRSHRAATNSPALRLIHSRPIHLCPVHSRPISGAASLQSALGELLANSRYAETYGSDNESYDASFVRRQQPPRTPGAMLMCCEEPKDSMSASR
jgi:hypothetical protein